MPVHSPPAPEWQPARMSAMRENPGGCAAPTGSVPAPIHPPSPMRRPQRDQPRFLRGFLRLSAGLGATSSWCLAGWIYRRQETAEKLEFVTIQRRIADDGRLEEDHQIALGHLFVAGTEDVARPGGPP